jgi:glycine/D-amino acid oxidase-like deaminating enzyme/nitrite reductase/ring-hydroxylating ferredoxin subunit
MSELDTTPYWDDSSSMPVHARLDRDLTVDVVIIGAGITGVTAAYLLKQAGRTVALIDRRRAGGVDSGHTTAHVTHVTDEPLTDLARRVGRDHAQAVWDAGRAALEQIREHVESLDIACEWTRIPGYLHAALGDDREDERPALGELAALANALGFPAEYVEAVPGAGRPGVRFEDQAKFHPRKYLAALVREIPGRGSHVFEHTESEEVTDTPLAVEANGHRLSCGAVVIATHTPLVGKTSLASATLLQTKLYLYTSYVVAGRVPKGSIPEASYWDTGDPYDYLRIDRHRDHDLAIFGGEDHKTGQASDTEACYRALEKRLRRLLPDIELTHRWSGQVVETNDGLPFIGETSPRQFVATGFAGNGMTFGTLGAMMARDAVLGRRNPWTDLFDVGRTKIGRGAWNYIKENVDYPYYMVRDRLSRPDSTSLRGLRRGQGRIVEIDGETMAVFRDDQGTLTRLSAKCTHLGCRVNWNEAERTWDCPCHGSRFTPEGKVLAGPAESPLSPVEERERVRS